MEGGFLSRTLGMLIDDGMIYENMAYFSSFGATISFIYVAFIALRLFAAGGQAISGKAALADALADGSKTVLHLIIYSLSGIAIFGVMFALAEVYSSYGSVDLINKEMYSIKTALVHDTAANREWYITIFESIVDAANLPMGAIVYLLYNAMGFFYYLINQFIPWMMSIGVALIYAYGFIAIASEAGPKSLQLTEGFLKQVQFIFLWLIVESIMLVFGYILAKGGGQLIISYYAEFGLGITATVIWYWTASSVMVLVILLRVMSPFIAMRFVMNTPIGTELGAPSALIAAKMFSQYIDGAQKAGTGIGEHSSPDGEGFRTRDKLMQGVNDMSKMGAGEAVSNMGRGISSVIQSALNTIPNNPMADGGGSSAGDDNQDRSTPAPGQTNDSNSGHDTNSDANASSGAGAYTDSTPDNNMPKEDPDQAGKTPPDNDMLKDESKDTGQTAPKSDNESSVKPVENAMPGSQPEDGNSNTGSSDNKLADTPTNDTDKTPSK